MDLSLLAEKEFFSIGDVAHITGVKPYVLRYWETRFGDLKPARRVSGQRKFTRRDVESVLRIKELLYERNFTIEGARKYLRQTVKRGPQQITFELSDSTAALQTLKDVKKEVVALLKGLKSIDYKPADPL